MRKNFNTTQNLIKMDKKGNVEFVQDVTQNYKTFSSNVIAFDPSTNNIAAVFGTLGCSFMIVVNTKGQISSNVILRSDQNFVKAQSIFYF